MAPLLPVPSCLETASTSAPGAGGGHATRRGHAPNLSISDPSHHVTEAIGHMYDDDYDRNDPRRLSYISSPLGESITTIPRNAAGSESSSPSTSQPNSPAEGQAKQTNGHLRPPLVGHRSFDRDTDPGSSDSTRTPSETATASFPLNDIDYESDPAAVVQELNNLAAIRRMSMDVAATGDPDLPSYGNNLAIPSLPPSPSADENDASRLFWVPASLHPELAPKEFKSFLESKADLIKRKSGDFSSLGPERSGSEGGLRRKRSMLSRQIDNSSGYTDGADRLERQRSQSSRRDGMLSPNLQELETLVDDSNPTDKESLVRGMQDVGIASTEDKPILPPAPPGHSLRRSTRTQYKKGSLKKGEKPPYSKRVGRGLSESAEKAPTIVPSPDDPPILGLTRVPTDSAATDRLARTPSSSSRSAAYAPAAASSTFDTIIDRPDVEQAEASSSGSQQNDVLERPDSAMETAAPYARQWHSRISSNGRSTVNIPPSAQQVPSIVETPPNEPSRTPSSASSPTSRSSERDLPTSIYSAKKSPTQDSTHSKRSLMSRQSGTDTTTTLNEFANNPQMIPGNSTRTDSLSFIPTMPEERKPEERKSEGKKSKKDSEGSRKSSWHWLLGSEEKDKKKDKDSDSKKTKSKLTDKVSSTSRQDVPQTSMDTSQKGRESLILDRLDPKLEEERRKDGARRASGDKKEKEGIFSSIFGGGRKKHSSEGHHHRKNSSRNLSPDPPVRVMRADVDYPWTRFSILEERAIYRMAHIKLANPRRALYSQVLLSNFMYSYLEKVQQMHPQMMVASSGSQRSSRSRDQPEEYTQYQRYQEAQDHPYGDNAYDDPSMYDYDDDPHDTYQTHRGSGKHGYENGNAYGSAHYNYGHSSFGDDVQLDDDDDDDMW
ncbi:uncharacterized protein N7459_001358 [Penicillium hispanicum]|uniref:uncharacterized protein n=1 Tax=Penicillium hispanicum TaxID=1080232 RepID=UPI0025405DD0|nr:uncharacterized protein N7459_001358 [Penicillium hispanicum]KAJ5595150.1 hypothetical protein N7459_001358 [Penicillium hispanicum]